MICFHIRFIVAAENVQQFFLRPLPFPHLVQIPFAHISCQLCFHDHHVQRPADFHCQPEERLVIFIDLIKIAHPAHVARGKACAVREIRLQELCGCDCRTLLRALADGFADGIDFVHLRESLCENCCKFPVHCAVIHRFSDVHSFSFPRAIALTIFLLAWLYIKPPNW